MSLSQSHQTVKISNWIWQVTANLAPQEISIEIRIDVDIEKYSIELKKVSEISRFVPQDWAEATMEFLA